MGVACPPAGSANDHSSLPVSASKARRRSSMAAAVKTRPPAVTIGPPRFSVPVAIPGTHVPRGTSHRLSPAKQIDRGHRAPRRGIAGQAAGREQRRAMHPVGRADLRSELAPHRAALRELSEFRGQLVARNEPQHERQAIRVHEEQPALGSYAELPQLTPPTNPGNTTVP
jgi:hypothetical protein